MPNDTQAVGPLVANLCKKHPTYKGGSNTPGKCSDCMVFRLAKKGQYGVSIGCNSGEPNIVNNETGKILAWIGSQQEATVLRREFNKICRERDEAKQHAAHCTQVVEKMAEALEAVDRLIASGAWVMGNGTTVAREASNKTLSDLRAALTAYREGVKP